MATASTLSELFVWRLVGAAAWHASILAVFSSLWSLALSIFSRPSPNSGSAHSFSLFLASLLLYGLQATVLYAHRLVLSSSESIPVQFPQLGVHGRSWISLALSRVILRGRKLKDVAAAGALFGSTAACAVAYLWLYSRLRQWHGISITSSIAFGIVQGAVYSMQHLLRCKDVLAYPIIQRHRYFRIKQRLPKLLTESAQLTILALLVSVPLGCFPHNLSQSLETFVAMVLCLFGWLIGQNMLQIVFTERHQLAHPGDADMNQPLMEALRSSDALVQDLALLDLAAFAEDRSIMSAARRAAIFADETGRAAWTPIGCFLLGELRDFVATLASALPTISGEAAAAKDKPAKVQWNALSLSSSTGMRRVSKEQDMAAWTVRSRYYRVAWSMRALSGLAAASRTEDQYGVVLLCDPNLADIMAALLSAILVLQQYITYTSSLTSRGSGSVTRALVKLAALTGVPPHITLRQVEHTAFAVEDLARSCAYRVATAFGPALKNAMQEMTLKPAYGSMADITALLNNILNSQE